MFISMPEKLIVKADYVDPEKLGISLDSYERLSIGDAEKLKVKLDNMLDYLYKRIMEYRSYVTDDELLKIHTELLEEFIEISVDGIDCLKKLKTTGYKGQDLDDLIDYHKNKFTGVFNFHANKFNCKKAASPKKSMNPDKLDMAIDKILEEVKVAFNDIVKMAKDLTLPEVLDIYKSGFAKIFSIHANNVECFKQAKTGKTNGKTFNELVDYHNNKFNNNLNNHTNMLGCK
ncbi:MAG: hypothetical protein RR898_09480 [Clostridium sp.]|uniref:hypothetical protein n=1 Tax=Clostridium sp. TaxID=1506 RepID=UPI002FCC48D6